MSTGVVEAGLVATNSQAAGDRLRRLARPDLDRAYHLAGLLLANEADAEEATQDSLMRAWRSMDSLRDDGDFRPWFDRIVINVCRDRLRRSRKLRFIPLEVFGDVAGSADAFRSVLDRDELLRAMATLDADLRLVIVLHYWADLTLEDVALRVGWPVGTVKSRLHRGLARIRATFDEEH